MLLYPQVVLDVFHARDPVDAILGQTLDMFGFHLTLERDFAFGYANLDVGCIDHRIVAEAVIGIFLDALVGTTVTLGAFAAVSAVFIAFEPGRDFLTRPLKEPAVFARMTAPTTTVILATITVTRITRTLTAAPGTLVGTAAAITLVTVALAHGLLAGKCALLTQAATHVSAKSSARAEVTAALPAVILIIPPAVTLAVLSTAIVLTTHSFLLAIASGAAILIVAPLSAFALLVVLLAARATTVAGIAVVFLLAALLIGTVAMLALPTFGTAPGLSIPFLVSALLFGIAVLVVP